ncbi:MAG: hypothetical protein NTV49_13315 [Kiritimatiellaeota bacterium]|nr:hypothetical protein [Kiritimatiellota bacterium]
MKKAVWMLALAAFVGFGLLQAVVAEDTAPAAPAKQHVRPEMKTFSGTIKVDGDTIKLMGTTDGDLVLKSRAGLDAYKAKDGQKVEIKGFVREKDGAKTLYVAGERGAGGHGKKKAE